MSEDFELRIRPVREPDVAVLEEAGHRLSGLAAHRLRDQANQNGLFLIAWVEEEFVGHAVLSWAGSTSLPEPLSECPDISDVWVQPAWRRRGIADTLLEVCETVARDQGYGRVGLSVGITNAGAIALYERRGYRRLEIGTIWERGSWRSPTGQSVAWDEECYYMVRELMSNSATA